MRWLLWLATGVTLGALILRKLSQTAQRLGPRATAGGLGARLTELADTIRDFAADVRVAMAEREAELRAATGLDGTAVLDDH